MNILALNGVLIMIKEGCKAIIIDDYTEENIGLIVTVGKFIGEHEDIEGVDLWEVDKHVMASGYGLPKKPYYVQNEKYLQRIDDETKTYVKEKLELEA